MIDVSWRREERFGEYKFTLGRSIAVADEQYIYALANTSEGVKFKIFDTVTGHWEAQDSLPPYMISVSGASASGVVGNLAVFRTSYHIFYYDILGKEWRYINIGKPFSMALKQEDKLYLFSGTSTTDNRVFDPLDESLTYFDVIDLFQFQYFMGDVRSHSHGIVDNTIYTFPYTEYPKVNRMAYWGQDNWKPVVGPALEYPYTINTSVMTVHGTDIYLTGGRISTMAISQVHRYDTVNEVYEELPSMPMQSVAHGAFIIRGKLYVVNPDYDLNALYSLDISGVGGGETPAEKMYMLVELPDSSKYSGVRLLADTPEWKTVKSILNE